MTPRSQLMEVFVLLCAVLPLCLGITDLAENYPFSATLKEGDYYLYWNFSTAEENIQFAVRVKTTGWIGFGLSPSGQMVDSDVVIGWIGDEDDYFHDRYAFQRQVPPIDPIQNWHLTTAEQENGYTQLEFYRDFITCDDLDREIRAETSRVVFSWNDDRPTVTKNPDGTETYSISKHQERGSTSINLLGGQPIPPDIPDDVMTFTVGVDQVEIPAIETEYYCKAIRLDENIRSQEQYIIKIAPALSTDSAAYVHHALVFICDGLEEEDLGPGGNCDTNVSSRVRNCLSSVVIGAWAVGGSGLVYPENIAYPIGGPSDKQFAVIQMHYNNPDKDYGVIDSSGLEFTYISTPREFDAGILFMGHDVLPTMMIPPGSSNYTLTAFCSSECTKQYFPPEGIHIFANMLHTHLLGTGVELSVVDETTCSTGQSRTEQTEIVEKNLHYDFNFQQTNHLPEEIIVKPGSTLLLNCYYDSSSRSDATLGGESTREEMCLTYAVYYPRTKNTFCISTPSFSNFDYFIENFVPEEYRDQFEQVKPGASPKTITATLGLLEWNSKQLKGFYDSLYTNGLQFADCDGDRYVSNYSYPPNLCCAYETENQCTGSTPAPCCERQCLNTQGGASLATTSSTYTLLLSVFLYFGVFY